MIGSLIKKEIKELLTRSTLVSIVIIAIMFGVMGSAIGNIGEQVKQTPVIGVINRDGGNLSDVATSILNANTQVVYNGGDVQEGLKNVAEKNGAALLIIPENFSKDIDSNHSGEIQVYWIMKGAGPYNAVQTSTIDGLIQQINNELSKKLIERDRSLNATLILNPTKKNETTVFKGRELQGVPPDAIVRALISQSIFVPIVIVLLIIMSGSIVISSMGLEKENKTLETLLTLPVKRTYIVLGKLVGSATVGLLLAAIYMIGLVVYLSALTRQGGTVPDLGMTLNAFDYVLIAISLFLALLGGLALAMVLGLFAKDQKSAQTLTFPITGLALVPMLVTVFADFDTLPVALKIAIFAIPFSHPMMAPKALMLGDYALVIGGIIYTALFAAAMIAVAVWIFKTDRLLTGTTRRERGSSRGPLRRRKRRRGSN